MDVLTTLRTQWDRSCAIGCAVAGAVVLILGWFGVSNTAYPAEQLPYILSAGLGGLFLLGVSSVLWLSADLRDEWRKLDAIERAIRESSPPAAESDRTPDSAFESGPRSRTSAHHADDVVAGSLR